MATYMIAFQSERPTAIYDGSGKLSEPPYFSVAEEFEAENDSDANEYAEANYAGQEWYILDSDGDNING